MNTFASAYTVSSLWRYPVKSMAGEPLDSISVTARGLAGDRAYALMDTRTSTVGSAKNVKRFGELLKCRAQFAGKQEIDAPPPPIVISLANGRTLHSTDKNIDAELSKYFGEGVSLVSNAPEGLVVEFAAGTLGGKFAQTTQLPVSSGAPKGTLFNYAAVHLVTTSTLHQLRTAYPDGDFAIERFRPNIVIDCPGSNGFLENEWVGDEIAIGSEVRLKVTIPCPRCVVPTLPRTGLAVDPGILRTIVEANRVDLGDFGNLPCTGVYADVVQPGIIHCGDDVTVRA